jgi:hypothetical protein
MRATQTDSAGRRGIQKEDGLAGRNSNLSPLRNVEAVSVFGQVVHCPNVLYLYMRRVLVEILTNRGPSVLAGMRKQNDATILK